MVFSLFPTVFFFFFTLPLVLGEITTTALLDRELKSEYILIVRAVDGGVGPQQKTGIATVTTRQHVSVFVCFLSPYLPTDGLNNLITVMQGELIPLHRDLG